MITLFFTGRKRIVPDVLLKGRKDNQPYFVHHIFPDLKEENRKQKRRNPESALWVHMDDSMYHNGSKIESKFGKHGLFRMPHPLYSPDISSCDF
jgi:ribosomal protein L16 Arg81 hydroxylase